MGIPVHGDPRIDNEYDSYLTTAMKFFRLRVNFNHLRNCSGDLHMLAVKFAIGLLEAHVPFVSEKFRQSKRFRQDIVELTYAEFIAARGLVFRHIIDQQQFLYYKEKYAKEFNC